MPETNAFTFAPPATQPKASPAAQAKQSHKQSFKAAHAAGQNQKPGAAAKSGARDGTPQDSAPKDSSLTSFMELLNNISAQPADGKSGAPLTPGLLAGQDGAAAPQAGKNGGQAFPKSVLDLMASLRSELEGEGVDVDALSEEMAAALNGTGPWDTKLIEAMLAGLRENQNHQAQLKNAAASGGNNLANGGAALSDALSADAARQETVEALLPQAPADDEEADDAREVPEAPDGAAKKTTETAQTAAAQAGLPSLPAENGGAEKADTPQPMTVLKFHAYLKADALKADKADVKPAAQETKPADGQAAAKDSVPIAGAAPVSSEAENELSGGLGGGQEQGAKQGDSPRPAAQSAAARNPEKVNEANKSADEVKPRTGFTENRTAFEQFFSAASARRETAAGAPAASLDLARGSPLSQGEALREGLDNVVRFVRTNGEQRANLIVDPPALGRISVELTSNAAGLEASIKVSTEQVRQLVQDHLTQLRLSLEQQGVQLTHFSVDVQQQDGERRHQEQGNARRRAGGKETGEVDAVEDESLFRVDLNQGLLYWVA